MRQLSHALLNYIQIVHKQDDFVHCFLRRRRRLVFFIVFIVIYIISFIFLLFSFYIIFKSQKINSFKFNEDDKIGKRLKEKKLIY